MNYFLYIPILVFLLSTILQGQESCNNIVQGILLDEHNKEPLAYAHIFWEDAQQTITTDTEGKFTIETCPGHLHLVLSYIGCVSKKVTLDIENHDTEVILYLEQHSELLSTINVNSSDNESQNTVNLSGEELEENSGKALGAMLRRLTGVNSIKSGPGIEKPVIHGMYGSRIRILNNGVQQEGQRWGADHAPEIDPFTAERIRVVKGAAAVQYGQGALGGAILIEAAPAPTDEHVHGWVQYTGLFNNWSNGLAAALEGGFHGVDALKWRVQASGQFAGDSRSANYRLTNTGIRQGAISSTLWYRQEHWSHELYYSFYGNENGILRAAHIGNLTDLKNAGDREIPYYTKDFGYSIETPKQLTNHHLIKAKSLWEIDHAQELLFSYNFQLNNRKEFDVRRGKRRDRPSMDLLLQTHDFEAKYRRDFQNFMCVVGLQNKLQFNRNLPGTGSSPLIPFYNQYQFSPYFVSKYKTSKWGTEIGFRYDYQHIDVVKYNRNRELEEPRHQYNNLAANLGTHWKFSKYLRQKVNIGLAYRAPNIKELYSEGVHHGAAAVEEGNRELVPEEGIKLNTTLSFEYKENINFEISAYYHYIKEYIYLEAQAKPMLTIRGAFPVFKYKQADANIWGIDAAAHIQVYNGLYWNSKASILFAENIEQATGLPLMPANRWVNSLNYRFPQLQKWIPNLQMGIEIEKVWRQTNTEELYMDTPNGYWLLNTSISSKIPIKEKEIKIQFAINNLMNQSYRDYLNRLRFYADDIGRNIELRFKYFF